MNRPTSRTAAVLVLSLLAACSNKNDDKQRGPSADTSLTPATQVTTNTICTINTYEKPQGFGVGHVAAIEIMDLSVDQYNFIFKKDGSVLEKVSYADAMYVGASSKFGDLTDAMLISVSRDRGSKNKGVNVLMAALSNDQKIARLELSVSSKSNDIFVHNMAKGISIGCQDEGKP